MNKAPRFMREYAAHIVKGAQSGIILNKAAAAEIAEKAPKIVRQYERGTLTARETMQLLTALC